MYTGRCLKEHLAAIKAVIRTKGDYTKLTDTEKPFFMYHVQSPLPATSRTFRKKVYNSYKKLIYDTNGKINQYDYVIMQERAPDVTRFINGRETPYYTAVYRDIMKALKANKKTMGIVLALPAKWYRNLDTTQTMQIQLDAEAKMAVKLIKSGTVCKAKAAFAGAAWVNYMRKYGTSGAEKYEKSLKNYEHENDLYLTDLIHPTQIGSFLHANVLYALVYREAANRPKLVYRGAAKVGTPNFFNYRPGRRLNQDKPLKSDLILKRCRKIAVMTQINGIRLK